MKHYLLSICHPGTKGEAPPRDVLDKIMQNVIAVRNDMKAANAWVFSGGLESPAAASVLRLAGDDVLQTDGPFVEAKEYIGGLTIVQAADADAAHEWGRRLARATGLPVEVRPFLEQHPC